MTANEKPSRESLGNRPFVSVLVPTLRRPHLLDRTLRALCAQDYPNFEIVVSDNGSGDDTGQVLASYANDSRVRTRSNVATIDMVSHWNQCLWEAQGEYSILISDDDLVTPDFVTDHVEAFAHHPNAVVTLPRTQIINVDDVVTETVRPVDWTSKEGHAFLTDWLWGKGRNPTRAFLSTMMRTRDARDLGGWPHFPGGANADNALFFAIALAGDVVFCSKSCFFYRVDTQSYGLRVDFAGLSESSRRFRTYVQTPEVARRLLALPPVLAQSLRDGVAHMLARQYFFRLHTVLAARTRRVLGNDHQVRGALEHALAGVGDAELARAFVHYQLDWESIKSFALYSSKTARKWWRGASSKAPAK